MPFYLDLARRLRVVQAQRGERAELHNPAKLEAGGLALDRVLEVLDGRGADALIDATQARVKTLLVAASEEQRLHGDVFAVGIEDRFLPQEPFERELVRFFSHGIGAPDPTRETMARAIVTALASGADYGGVLSGEDLSRLGSHAVEVGGVVDAARGLPPTTAKRLLLKYNELDDRVMKQVALSKRRQTFVDRMPVLGEVTRLLGSPVSLAHGATGAGALDCFTLASVQHLFPSTLGLYDALVDNGLPRNTAGVGGKNYSANADAVARMHADGFEVAYQSMPVPQEAGLDAETLVLEMAREELHRLFAGVDPNEKTPRFLLLDEGGKLIRALHEDYPRYAHLCVAVEQTDRGIQIIEEMKARGIELLCPVINMARSVAKKVHEAPMIGESVVFHTEHELAAMRPGYGVETPEVATIIGYGAVGKATADALRRRGTQVHVWDTDPQKRAAARADGCTATTREDALAHAHVLFGCTGHTVLTPDAYDLLPDGAVLVNAASGNHELGLNNPSPGVFRDVNLRKADDGRLQSRFRGEDVIVGDATAGEAMMNRVIHTRGGKEVVALRSGYVVNMTLGLPPEYVQLTLAMLLASCLEAVKHAGSAGLKDLPMEVQDFIVKRSEACLVRIGHDPKAPDFRSLASWQL